MLMSKNSLRHQTTSITTKDKDADELLDTEWLLTNSRGGFACGTVAGCNTRRYHGLLIGSLNPPANRIMALSNCREVLIINGREIELGCFEFEGAISTNGLNRLVEFSKDIGAHFDYDFGAVSLTKSIYPAPDSDMVAIVYDFSSVSEEFDFSVRPLIGMRDFHSLQKSYSEPSAIRRDYGIAITTEQNDVGELFLQADQMSFERDPQWWYNFLYRKERQRGQDYLEDLWSPGVFRCRIDSPDRIVLWAGLSRCDDTGEMEEFDLDVVLDSLILREKELTRGIKGDDKRARILYSAAGQFVIERQIAGEQRTTVLAGYPWFLDWGRDTFIALAGLLICTGRIAEAAEVLKTFAQAVSKGMIPNRFDDYGAQAHYNSIDAPLWFVHAAFEYLRVSGDTASFSVDLLPAVRWVIDSYRKGTRFGIHADDDGLITGGGEDTQLTWMDAKCNDKVFTPRYGKAVEINALWYNALCNLAEFYKSRNAESAHYYTQLAQKVNQNFARMFWNGQKGYLNDCILPDGAVDDSLRPNQIYAVSLRFSPLETWQQKSVVDMVQSRLLTPFGLRTLDKHDNRFIGQYTGDQQRRDAAYHNGTVWPYLIGAFIEAYLKVNNFSRQSKRKATRFLRPLLKHLTKSGCIGSISEIFDGDEPQRPKGCFAQAWSVAEVLRAYQMITR